MTLTVRPIESSGKDFRSFVEFPYQLNRHVENWVPNLKSDVIKLFDRSKNPFFEHAEVQAFVAERPEGKGARIVGRIAAIENRLHNEIHEDRVGFFGFFDCEEDPEAAMALFEAAGAWLSERGFDTMRGPVNFSTNDDCGLLIQGFHRPPAILMPFNPPYYEKLVEAAGFTKAKDLFAFYHEGQAPDFLRRAGERVKRRSGATTRGMDMSRFAQEVDLIRDLYNGAWEKNWGFIPLTQHEVDHLARELKPVVDPNLVRFVEVDGETVGFTLSLPDLNQVLTHLDGRLGPWGMVKYLWYSKKINMLRTLTLGVKESHRSMGLDSLLYLDLYDYGNRRGIHRGEFSWVLEDNLTMCKPLERIGASVDRVYRIYDRPLTPNLEFLP